MSLIGRFRQMGLTCFVNINPTVLGLGHNIKKSLNKFTCFISEKDTTIMKMEKKKKTHTKKKTYLVGRNCEMPVIKFCRTSWFREA